MSPVDSATATNWRRLEWSLTLGNLLASLLVFAYFWELFDIHREANDSAQAMLLLGAYWVVAAPVTVWRYRRRIRPAVRALEAGRADPADRQAILDLPWRFFLIDFEAWAVAAALFLAANLPFDAYRAERITAGILLGAGTASTLTFLIGERGLRPVFAIALAGDPTSVHSRLGIRPRMLVSWALGSGIPLLACAVAPLGLTGRERARVASFMVALALSAVVVGWLTTLAAARSVAEPLDEVRRALADIEGGDLSAAVSVNDGGDAGTLQAGFNRMVHGLRERFLLEDLFGRHVGPQVVRSAVGGMRELGGAQCDVSAVFVDVIGSTALAYRLPPDQVVSVLNELFAEVVATVEDHRGLVNQFLGDGALCVFGAPEPNPDHAGDALRAARSLRSRLDGVRRRYPELDVGMGISSGPVVAGNLGAPSRYTYTVIGDAVNEAARLCELAKKVDGRVVASQATVERASGEASRWMPEGDASLRGREAPTRYFRPAPEDPRLLPAGGQTASDGA